MPRRKKTPKLTLEDIGYVGPPPTPAARLFTLERDRDLSGISGTGTVADGVVWPDGTVSIRWRGDRPSTVAWNSLADAEYVHGHGGATRFVWDDRTEED
ncbi:hypothetical protein AB0B15_39750 [Streptomyces sp. NPDC045456]|uniref:hypothetical protein n=1 Tax=Streptomyces sp. NPDC045456 TaxID=3155254 RepID=UPI0033FDFD29